LFMHERFLALILMTVLWVLMEEYTPVFSPLFVLREPVADRLTFFANFRLISLALLNWYSLNWKWML